MYNQWTKYQILYCKVYKKLVYSKVKRTFCEFESEEIYFTGIFLDRLLGLLLKKDFRNLFFY